MLPHPVVLAFLAVLTGFTLASSTTTNCNNGVCITTQCNGAQCASYNSVTGEAVQFDTASGLELIQEYGQQQQRQQQQLPVIVVPAAVAQELPPVDEVDAPQYEEVGPLEALPTIIPDEVAVVETQPDDGLVEGGSDSDFSVEVTAGSASDNEASHAGYFAEFADGFASDNESD